MDALRARKRTAAPGATPRYAITLLLPFGRFVHALIVSLCYCMPAAAAVRAKADSSVQRPKASILKSRSSTSLASSIATQGSCEFIAKGHSIFCPVSLTYLLVTYPPSTRRVRFRDPRDPFLTPTNTLTPASSSASLHAARGAN